MEERDSKAEDWCFVCKDGGDLILCNNGLSSHSFLMPRPSSHHILCMISSFLFSFQQLLKGVPSRMPRSRLRLPLPNPNHLSYSRRLDLRYFTPPFHSSAFYYQFPNILYIYIYIHFFLQIAIIVLPVKKPPSFTASVAQPLSATTVSNLSSLSTCDPAKASVQTAGLSFVLLRNFHSPRYSLLFPTSLIHSFLILSSQCN